MKFISLQSGSAGNCFLIQTDNKNILIDVGITEKQIVNRLKFLGVSMDEIDAVLITHEHSDHIKSIDFIDPSIVYATEESLPNIQGFNKIKPYGLFLIGDVHVVPIKMSHDVKNGVGYLIHDGKESLLYLTDTGYVKKEVIPFMMDCTHYIIESNYNYDMLMSSPRPMFLKKRISSRKGHLSNLECGEVLSTVVGNNTRTILLSHVSGQCNSPEVCYNDVLNVLKEHNVNLDKIEINVASRSKITFGRKEYEQF